jgi:hypothetical protein
MKIVVQNYALFIFVMIASAFTDWAQRYSSVVLSILAAVTLSCLVLIGRRTGGRRQQKGMTPELHKQLDRQMSILMMLVVSGLIASIQVIVDAGDYSEYLELSLKVVNGVVYLGSICWIGVGIWRLRGQATRATAK